MKSFIVPKPKTFLPPCAQPLCFCSGALLKTHLSHETKRRTKIKTYSLHLTTPLQNILLCVRAYYPTVQSPNLILLIRLKWFVLLVTIVN